MKSVFVLLVTGFMVLGAGLFCQVRAQEEHPARIELGVQFSSLRFSDVHSGGLLTAEFSTTNAFGGRFTFNLSRHFALEAEGNFFPHPTSVGLAMGRVLQGQAGVKAGQRFKHFGLFGKARPGIISISDVFEFTVPRFEKHRGQFFSFDVGGVIEFYPSHRVLTRIDVGDTIIWGLPGGTFTFPTRPRPATHNLQVSAGIGFRLLNPEKNENENKAVATKPHRLTVGAQFASLSVSVHDRFFGGLSAPFDFRDILTSIGFGGRLTYDVNDHVAVEGEGNFFPDSSQTSNRGRSGGRILQGQFGVKVGKRFRRFGIFGKARPGVVSFGRTVKIDRVDTSQAFPIVTLREQRSSYFSTDLGGVLEFYPSRRIVTRFDAGDTLIRYGATRVPVSFTTTIENVPPATEHNFQFSAGVGIRF
jgi:hypothetical protein